MRLTRPHITDAAGFSGNLKNLSKILDVLGYAALKVEMEQRTSSARTSMQQMSKEAKKALKSADHLLK